MVDWRSLDVMMVRIGLIFFLLREIVFHSRGEIGTQVTVLLISGLIRMRFNLR